jgi:5-methylcytosine-specific restriction enzyme subunit McrC
MGISNLFATGPTQVFSFLLDMNALFEAFVYMVLKRVTVASPLDLFYQHSDRSIIVRAGTNHPYARVVPDILLRRKGSEGPKLVLDAKYKPYDINKVGTADIYQAFLYAYAFSANQANRVSGLIYPSTNPTGGGDELCVRNTSGLANANVSLIGLSIPTILDEMRMMTMGPGTEALRTLISKKLKS